MKSVTANMKTESRSSRPRSRAMFRIFILISTLTALTLGGAVTASAAGEEDKAKNNFDFFDSGAFDRQLSSALRSDPPEITITFLEQVSVNKIPQRLDKWLSQVEHYGGKVELKQEGDAGTRGILGAVLDLIIGVYELAKEKIMYGPVEDYNAVIIYEKGSGVIKKVVFTRKTTAPGDKSKG
ncbi:MAG: hypothetical protein AB1641_24775 [Thermodesulfobacteriota bacterium]